MGLRFHFTTPLAMTCALTLALQGCYENHNALVQPGGKPSNCLDNTVLEYPEGDISLHRPKKILVKANAAMVGVTWASADSIQAFFGTKNVKVAVSQAEKLYLVSWASGTTQVYELSQGDEMTDLSVADISSPLFSADGNWLTYAGGQGAQGFVMKIQDLSQPTWRVPLDTTGYQTADPHWVMRNGMPWIYFSKVEDALDYDPKCQQFPDYTYRVRLANDSTIDSLQPTGFPGTFRGGVSKDLVWVGTAYSDAGLYNIETPTVPTRILGGGYQKCNPSMNPYVPGSTNTDFFMLLGFGGPVEPYLTPLGVLHEGLHQNLWIHNAGDTIVWQGKLPDSSHVLWEKPEWSTHPLYATGVAARKNEQDSPRGFDMYAVKIPDLSNARRDTLYQADGTLQMAKGGFGSGAYTHLWVGN